MGSAVGGDWTFLSSSEVKGGSAGDSPHLHSANLLWTDHLQRIRYYCTRYTSKLDYPGEEGQFFGHNESM